MPRRMAGRAAPRVLRLLCALAVLAACGAPLRAAEPGADDVAGWWLTEDGEGVVEIRAATVPGVYEGRIVSGADEAPPVLDVHNPNPALRGRRIFGLRFMTGFRWQPPDRWVDGRIYSPEDGNVYRGSLRLDAPDRLVLRGYIGIPLLGASQIWTRLAAPPPGAELLPPM